MIIIFVILFVILLFWVLSFIYANDFSIPSKNISKDIKKVLIVFPHADDEALTSGGLLSQLSKLDKETTWVVLTQGEKGNEGAKYNEKLKDIRKQEAENAKVIYGVDYLIQGEYPDNGITEQKDKLREDLKKKLGETKPDLVITYDLAGLYGHPDHIIVSEVITDLLKENYPNIKIWYASYPKRLLDAVSLPEQMAEDSSFKDKRSYPTFRVWVGLEGVINKVKAVYNYKSQQSSYIKSLPVKQIPLWFYISLTPFEYYHEVK